MHARHVRKIQGKISRGAIYTTEGCMRFGGLGHETLAEARRSGMVTPIEIGRRHYYRGDELIAWIESQAQAKSQAKSPAKTKQRPSSRTQNGEVGQPDAG